MSELAVVVVVLAAAFMPEPGRWFATVGMRAAVPFSLYATRAYDAAGPVAIAAPAASPAPPATPKPKQPKPTPKK